MLSKNIQELVDIFDIELEPSLEFGKEYNGKNLRLHLDKLIESES